MADQADVYVENRLKNNIYVIRKSPDGSSDLEITLATGSSDRIYLTTGLSLIIKSPDGVDTNMCSIGIKSDVDLSLSCSRTDFCWTIQIVPNNLPPDVPTTVTVSIKPDGS